MSEFVSICPKCRQRIMCDTAYVGQRVACPLCLEEIGIAAPPPPSGVPAAEAPAQAVANTGRKPLLWISLIAGVVILGSLAACAAMKLHTPNPAPEIAPASAPAPNTPAVAAAPEAVPLAAPVKPPTRVVSWHLDDHGTINGSSVSYNGTAGVVPVANWNNSYPDDRTNELLDATGTPTSLNLAYGSFNTFRIQDSHPEPDADGSYNKELLNSYLNGGPATRTLAITNSFVTVSSIPYARYDVYVYFCSDAAERIGNVTDGAITYDFSTLGHSAISGPNALLKQTTDQNELYPPADYAIFHGETARVLTIKANAMGGNDQWLGIAGIQIVDTAKAH